MLIKQLIKLIFIKNYIRIIRVCIRINIIKRVIKLVIFLILCIRNIRKNISIQKPL